MSYFFFLTEVIIPLVSQGFDFSFNSAVVNFCKENLLNELLTSFFKLKDVAPAQVLNILKEYFFVKTFKATLLYVLIIIRFKLINWYK